MTSSNPYESLNLSEYEQKIFFNMDTAIHAGIRYKVDQNRPDRDQLIASIKKYIDVWGNIEFNRDYTKFRRIESIYWLSAPENPIWKTYDRHIKTKNTLKPSTCTT